MTTTDGCLGALRSVLHRLLPASDLEFCQDLVEVPPSISGGSSEVLTRAQAAYLLNILLLAKLAADAPNVRCYLNAKRNGRSKILLDHGALRTVAEIAQGGLPLGRLAIDRILVPLGYAVAATYPLDRIGMMGFAYRHHDLPDTVPQYFVSEFYPKRFSGRLQAIVADVGSSAVDPLPPASLGALTALSETHRIRSDDLIGLLPRLVSCFGRHHRLPTKQEYLELRAESEEMAWISTEGHTFNHATARVGDIESEVKFVRGLGLPLKRSVEVSKAGTVFQTAIHADTAIRSMIDNGKEIEVEVPGSFFEFIERRLTTDGIAGSGSLDLRFDAANAQAIFKMTA